jgi:hypothetical protein
MARESEKWQSMEFAPKDRPIDIIGKKWNPLTDAFELRRFIGCVWFVPQELSKIPPHFHGLPRTEYRAVCWREVPEIVPAARKFLDRNESIYENKNE